VSGVVFLPPRPKQRLIRSVLTRLRSVLHPQRAPGAPRAGAATGAPTSREELRVRCRRRQGAYTVELAGTLHERTREPLIEVLEEALEDEAGQIILDLGALEAIDHAGLDAVLTAHLRACDQLKALLIVPGPEPVQRVFDNAQAPFLYTSGRGGRIGRRARSRGRRTGLSGRPSRPEASPQTLRPGSRRGGSR
jgi:anti-anti-sigma factor